MASWVTLNELDWANMKRNYKDRDGESLVKQFKYWQPFGFHVHYHHQVDNNKNRRHYPISLESRWATKFWMDYNFAWYLFVMVVNIALACGHFPNGGDIIPTLAFQRQLAMQCMENNFLTDPNDIGTPMRACRRPQIVELNVEKVPNYLGKWQPSEKIKISEQKYQKQHFKNHS